MTGLDSIMCALYNFGCWQTLLCHEIKETKEKKRKEKY